MPAIIPDEGEIHALAIVLGAVGQEALELRLYVNDKTPGLTDLASDYVEMTGHGYAPKTLEPGVWAFTPADAGKNTPGKAVAENQVFAFDAAGPPVNVFGYYLVGAESGRLWLAERAPEPYRVQNPGDQITIKPTLRLRSEYPL